MKIPPLTSTYQLPFHRFFRPFTLTQQTFKTFLENSKWPVIFHKDLAVDNITQMFTVLLHSLLGHRGTDACFQQQFFGRDDGEVSCESKGIPGIPPNEKPPPPAPQEVRP